MHVFVRKIVLYGHYCLFAMSGACRFCVSQDIQLFWALFQRSSSGTGNYQSRDFRKVNYQLKIMKLNNL